MSDISVAWPPSLPAVPRRRPTGIDLIDDQPQEAPAA